MESITIVLHRQHYSLSFFCTVNVNNLLLYHQPVCKHCLLFTSGNFLPYKKTSHCHCHITIPIPSSIPTRIPKLPSICDAFVCYVLSVWWVKSCLHTLARYTGYESGCRKQRQGRSLQSLIVILRDYAYV